MRDINSLLPEDLAEYLREAGYPDFHAKQIFAWVHGRGADGFAAMSDLPLPLRERLGKDFYIVTLISKKTLASADGDTVKYLYALPSGELLETVLMRYRHGLSVCVSTQIGCRMGCRFCASHRNGFVRNLTPGEIAAQVTACERAAGERVSSVVMMGMGEPLDNFSGTVGAVRLLTHPAGVGIGARHISVSTCGVVPGILELAKTGLPVTLSVSLHAVSDERRSAIMPVNRRWGIGELLAACREYQAKGGRRISFEYALIAGQNSSPADADTLARLLWGITAHVNLIPVNPVEGAGFSPPDRRAAEAFRDRLISHGVNATIRRTLGADIGASCGQLRNRNLPSGGGEAGER